MASDLTWLDNCNCRQDGAAAHVDGVREGVAYGPPPSWQLGDQRAQGMQHPANLYGNADADVFLLNHTTPCRNQTPGRGVYVHLTTKVAP